MSKKRFEAIGLALDEIVLDGNDVLAELFEETSTRSAEEPPLAAIEESQFYKDTLKAAEVAENAADDELDAAPTHIDERVVRTYEQARKNGVDHEKALRKTETYARNAPPPDPGDLDDNDQDIFKESRDTDLSSDDINEINEIGTEVILDLYDEGQAFAGIFLYDFVNKPKEQATTLSMLRTKIVNGSANQYERDAYFHAEIEVANFAKRKEIFADKANMKASHKARALKLMNRLFAIKGISINPWVLLGLILLSPVVLNLIGIYGDKFGFNGDEKGELTGKFNSFLDKQEDSFNKRS